MFLANFTENFLISDNKVFFYLAGKYANCFNNYLGFMLNRSLTMKQQMHIFNLSPNDTPGFF